MKAKIVTGFVPLVNPRNVEQYYVLGRRLTDMGWPFRFFDERATDMWLWKWLKTTDSPGTLTHSVSDNPDKNTLAYHCVQHQKSEWLLRAAMEDTDSDVFVWIDYGIFHVPGVSEGNILAFLDRVDNRGLLIPGCHAGRGPIDDAHPCWRFCGGVVVAPRRHLFAFDQAVKKEAKRHIRDTGNVSWEVNTWARADLSKSLPVTWYQADHNETMFTNYGRSECLEYA